jgi:hypothetical protein
MSLHSGGVLVPTPHRVPLRLPIVVARRGKAWPVAGSHCSQAQACAAFRFPS